MASPLTAGKARHAGTGSSLDAGGWSPARVTDTMLERRTRIEQTVAGENMRGTVRCLPLTAGTMATFVEAEWRHLVMAHYRVDQSLLMPWIPAGTELDDWNGNVFLSLVGLRFMRTRVLGLSVPFHRNFDEINLRLYVRRAVDGETRRGVVFIKEVVSVPAVAFAANLAYNEKYEIRRTRSRVPRRLEVAPARLTYEWKSRSGWNRLRAVAGDGPFVAAPNSRDHFLTDRPWGYTRQRDGGTVEYRVHHPPWRLWRVKETDVRCHATELYGPEFEPVLSGEVYEALIAEGSSITISTPVRIA